MLIFSLLESDDEGGNNSIDMTILSIVITLGLLIVISATIIVCFYQRKKKQKLNVFTENLSHIYDVPDYAKLSKIELKAKDRSDGNQQVSCETEATVAYGHSCDVETNIAYGLAGCSVPQPQSPQTSNGETNADTEEYCNTEMKPQ